MDRILAGVIWWPHSGGRWLCRSILKNHSKVFETAMVHPWIFNTTDMTLELDITAQVHKARSLPELRNHLKALKESTDMGRLKGLESYFNAIAEDYLEEDDKCSHILGEICMGSPIPKYPDMDAIYKAYPNFKTIHLVRSPIDSFRSFTERHEMDDDPIKVAGSWLSLNAKVRKFFELNEEFKSNYHLVRYEDLLSNSEFEVKRLCGFLGLEFEDLLMSSFEERWGKGTKPSISQDDKAIIEEVAYSELKKYNYL